MKRRSSSRKMKGSFTLEAAVLIPLTVLILAAILIASFYIHDTAVLQGNACECAAAGANALTLAQQEQRMDQTKNRIKAGRLLGSRNRSGRAGTQGEQAKAAWTAEYPIPGMGGNLFADRRIPIAVSWSQEQIRPVRKIRIIRGVSSIFKKKEGIE